MRPFHLLLGHGRKAATVSEVISDIGLLFLVFLDWSEPVSGRFGASGISRISRSYVSAIMTGSFSRPCGVTNVVTSSGAHYSINLRNIA